MELPLTIGVGPNSFQVGTIDIDPKEDPTLALAATLEAVAAEMRLAVRDRAAEAASVDLSSVTDATEVAVVPAPDECLCGTDLAAIVHVGDFITEGGHRISEIADPNCWEHGEMARAFLRDGTVPEGLLPPLRVDDLEWRGEAWEKRFQLPREAIAPTPEDQRADAVASLAQALDVPPELLASDIPPDVNHWSHWTERPGPAEGYRDPAKMTALYGSFGADEEGAMACTPVACPPFQEVSLEVDRTVACTCGDLPMSEWGNPWGRVDCPFHEEAVARMLAREVEEFKRDVERRND